ncbi:MAG TPA: thiamine pyrophosphate-requiring protein [Steroidobacteraceae bacterium]|nr:thiamine pyrophosphate-requiring protein [Steroidobacteraceae bacterium]
MSYPAAMYTAGMAFLEALQEAGVEYLFANLGSDHTALIEAQAAAAASGRALPKVITCPHEMVALSAAHGFAQASGRAQAVVVHVECGTQSLGGAIHNAAKGRVPVLIFAGTSPATQEGEARGSRNEFIHWIQDVFDQRGLVRGYMRYDGEIRSGANVKQVVNRALQFAYSDPKGPVYLMAAREVMEQEIKPVAIDRGRWPPIAAGALAHADAELIARELAGARRPLVVTSYAGRNVAAVEELVRLCTRIGAGVLESVPCYVNFPTDNPCYQGSQWNEQRQNPALAQADVILIVDSDVPWIPTANRPAPEARIIHIDVDPLKQQMPLWYVGAHHVHRADAATALGQINAALAALELDERRVSASRAHYAKQHDARKAELARREEPRGDELTGEYLTACVRRAIGPDAIVISEGVTHFPTISNHAGRSRSGTLFNSGGGSLGWAGGAAVGVKLARPDALVAGLMGDGCYMFSVPSTVHWMARRYETPFLQVIYNNRGWKAPRFSTLSVHPQGHTSRTEDIGTSFDPPPDYGGIAAAAGGAHAEIVRRPDEVEPALERALRAVREEKRCAVIDAWLPA